MSVPLIVRRSATFGAIHSSPYSLPASRPYIVRAPAKCPIHPSPVESTNIRPRQRVQCPVSVLRERTAAIRAPSFSTRITRSLRKSERLGLLLAISTNAPE